MVIKAANFIDYRCVIANISGQFEAFYLKRTFFPTGDLKRKTDFM